VPSKNNNNNKEKKKILTDVAATSEGLWRQLCWQTVIFSKCSSGKV
jgi:hypothetical protein